MYDIRKPNENDYPELVRIVAEAYPGIGVFTEEARKKTEERLRKAGDDKRLQYYAAFSDDEMVGLMRLHDFEMNVHGVKMLAGGVGNVAVDLVHKKAHVAKELVEFYLDHYEQKNAPMAVLWPFRHDFYRKMGFGLGAKTHRYAIKPQDLPNVGDKNKVRFLTAADVLAMNDCYNRYVPTRSGLIYEHEILWKRYFENQQKTRFVGYEDEGKLQGFFCYEFASGKAEGFLDNNMEISWMIYESSDALLGMLSFLHAQLDQVNRVVLCTPDNDFYFMLNDVTNGSGNMFPSVNHESHISGVGIMYRVLSVRRLFEALADHDFGGVNMRLKLTIEDSLWPKNAGEYCLEFVDGRASIVESAEVDCEVGMDIAEFSSMVLGAVGFKSLLTYRLATISDDGLANDVDRAFACAEKPLCLTGF